MAEDGDRETTEDAGEEGGIGGGLLAVTLLIILLAGLVFVFRVQLGLGGTPTENDIANQIDVNVH